MPVDIYLVEKGCREPRSGLVDEARAHVELARRYAASLAENGWLPSDTDALEKAMIDLEPTPGGAISEGEAREATAAEWAAIGEAKEFLRRLHIVAPILARRRPQLLEAIPFEENPGSSAASLSAYLERIRPGLTFLDDGSRRYFKGATVSEALDRIKFDIEASRAREAAQIGSLTEDDATISEAKGRLLEMMDDLDRVGELTFDGQTAIADPFRKDILQQARRANGG